jgi:hypothetical protein
MWQTSDDCAGTWSLQPQYAWWYVTPHKNQFQSTVCDSILLCDYRKVHRNKMSTVMTAFLPVLSFFSECILSSKFHRPKAIPVICVFLSLLSDMQTETFLHRIVLDGLSGYDVFLLIISYRWRFLENMLLTRNVFWYSLQPCLKIFSFLGRIQWDNIKGSKFSYEMSTVFIILV